MINRSVVILFLIAVLVSSVLFANIRFRKYYVANKVQVDSIVELNGTIGYLLKNNYLSNKYNGVKMADSIFCKCKEMNNEDSAKYVNLIGRIGSAPYSLVLRYTEIGCNMCNDMTVSKLKEFKSNNPDIKVYAFIDFSILQSYLQWRKGSKVDFDVFYKQEGSLPIDEDSHGFSYLFLLDKSGRICKVFIPDSRYPKLLDNFLLSNRQLVNERK